MKLEGFSICMQSEAKTYCECVKDWRYKTVGGKLHPNSIRQAGQFHTGKLYALSHSNAPALPQYMRQNETWHRNSYRGFLRLRSFLPSDLR